MLIRYWSDKVNEKRDTHAVLGGHAATAEAELGNKRVFNGPAGVTEAVSARLRGEVGLSSRSVEVGRSRLSVHGRH
jgi:hypothetical protein